MGRVPGRVGYFRPLAALFGLTNHDLHLHRPWLPHLVVGQHRWVLEHGGRRRKWAASPAGCRGTDRQRQLEYWTYYATLHPSSYRSGGASPPEPPRRVPLPRVRIAATRARFRGCGGPFRASDPSRRDHSGRERPSRGGRSSTAGGRAFRAAPGGRKAGSLTFRPDRPGRSGRCARRALSGGPSPRNALRFNDNSRSALD